MCPECLSRRLHEGYGFPHFRHLSGGPNIVFTGGAGHHRPGHKLRRLIVLALASHKGDAAQRDLLDVLEGEVDGLHLVAALIYPRDRELPELVVR